LHGEASRFLRGSVGAAVSLLLVAFARLIAPAPHEISEPTATDLDAASAIIDQQTSTFPYLVFLRDKGVLFDDVKTGFVMFAVQGRTWVALGDPVGPPERTSDLIRIFLEKCDDFDGVPAFYEVRKDQFSGFERSPVAPLRSRLGSFVYEHGEAFYHFQGLRAYKEKFHPQWEPRYLVYPGGLRLPRILTDVAALVAGGYRKALLK
jgi:lysylphosphatidylglycerol synthetase-like protein (DUF2156 family)